MKNLNKPKKISIISLILKLIETILTILVVAICVLIITQRVTNNEYGLLGYRLFKIETGSMIPKYNINDVILVKEVDTENIKIKDAVVYKGNVGELNGRIITHEVVDIKEENGKKFFYTKGIANTTMDPKVSESQILGVVVSKVVFLSVITNFLSNIYTLYFFIILPASVYIVFVLIHSGERKERKIQAKIRERQEQKEKEEKEYKKKTERTTTMNKNKKAKKDTDKKKT